MSLMMTRIQNYMENIKNIKGDSEDFGNQELYGRIKYECTELGNTQEKLNGSLNNPFH